MLPVTYIHIHLTTIAHAFNYRVAVLRDSVRSATRVGRSRRAEGRILEDTDVPWGHLMYSYPANHGDMLTIVVGVVNVYPQTVQALMFTGCPSYPGRVYLYRHWSTSQSLLGEVVRG